jgi:hypothetical protein
MKTAAPRSMWLPLWPPLVLLAASTRLALVQPLSPTIILQQPRRQTATSMFFMTNPTHELTFSIPFGWPGAGVPVAKAMEFFETKLHAAGALLRFSAVTRTGGTLRS